MVLKQSIREGIADDRRPLSFGWVVVVIVVFFCVAYACALTFEYVEGDDSRAVVHALLGVGNKLFGPMQYHSMASLLLSLLPKDEPLLRIVTIATSAVGAMTYLLLVSRIAWHWALQAKLPRWLIVGFLAATPLIIPEFVFLGLLYEPVVIAMTIVLIAHLIVRPAFARDEFSDDARSSTSTFAWRLVISSLLFGFGVSLRWDTAFYGSVIAMDLLLCGWKGHRPIPLIGVVVGWGCAALLAMFGALAVSGFPPSAIVNTYHWTQETVALAPSLSERLLDGVTLLTPVFLLLIGMGFLSIVLRIRDRWQVLLLLLASAPLFIIVGTPSFCAKAFVTVMPTLFLVLLYGATLLWEQVKRCSQSMARLSAAALLLLLVVPWLMGIQWKPPHSARGPGFAFSAAVSPDKSKFPHPAFAGGLGAPTPEGPRPLWGFAHVLFGGEWRAFVRDQSDEWNAAVDLAIEKKLPIHQDTDTGFVMARLMEKGYTLLSARVAVESPGVPKSVHHRLYEHSESGEHMEVLLISGLDQHLKRGQIPELFAQLEFERVVVAYAFPSRLLELVATSDGTVTALGPLTAVWILPKNSLH